MKYRVLIVGFCLLLVQAASAQQAAPAKAPQAKAGAAASRLTRVIGEVIAVDEESRLMTVKADSGQNFTFVFAEQSTYLQVPPGEKTLEKAAPIALGDIGRGDRVYGRGEPLEDGHTVPVQQLIVMAQAAITKKHDAEQEEWDRRGVLGTVVEVKQRTKEVVLQTRSRRGAGGSGGAGASGGAGGAGAAGGRGGPGALAALAAPPTTTVRVTDNAKIRRYAPDSVKFADAKPSSLAEIKEGDQVRALGQRSADGTVYTAEQLVSGSFRMTWGTVLAVNADANELKLKVVPGGETVTVTITKDSVLRAIPKEFAAMMAQQMTGGFRRPGGPGGEGPGGAGVATAGAAAGAAGSPGGRPAATGGPTGEPQRRRNEDFLDRLPPTTLAELKVGDAVTVFSTAGKNAARVTAIAFVSGVEPFLPVITALAQMPQRAGRGGQGVSLGLPGGALDMGMGLP